MRFQLSACPNQYNDCFVSTSTSTIFTSVFLPLLLFNLLIHTTYHRLLFAPFLSSISFTIPHFFPRLSFQSVPPSFISLPLILSSYSILYTLVQYRPILPLLDVTIRSGQPSGNAMSFTDPAGIK